MQKPKLLTVIIPIIRGDLIERCIETLYKYTEVGMFYTFIIDQTIVGIDSTELRNKYRNLMVIRTPKSDVHYTGNLGFAQATNLGISLVQTPYFMMLNDDCEMVNSGWWQGVMDTFEKVEKVTPERPAVIVNPASIKLPDWSVGLPKGQDHYILPYKKNYTEEDWRWLIDEPHYVNQHLTIQPGSVIDGVTMYASICDTQKFLSIGMLPEQMYPGGGEDYWFSALASMHGYRSVGTTLSWVFHYWSKSFESIQDEENIKKLVQEELKHNNNHEDWGPKFDIWGVKCSKCNNILRIKNDYDKLAVCPQHPEETYTIPESHSNPL